MTDDQRKALADRLFAEHIYYVDYIRGSMGLMAVLPILYGVMTWLFGDDLWAGSEIYKTALMVPYSPQSWGTLFFILGTTLMVCALTKKYLLVEITSGLTALVIGMFMVMFFVEYAARNNESALPPAVTWCVFSLLFLNLARLASKMRRLKRSWSDLSQDE